MTKPDLLTVHVKNEGRDPTRLKEGTVSDCEGSRQTVACVREVFRAQSTCPVFWTSEATCAGLLGVRIFDAAGTHTHKQQNEQAPEDPQPGP